MDSNMDTASQFSSCPTSQCTTASDLYMNGKTPDDEDKLVPLKSDEILSSNIESKGDALASCLGSMNAQVTPWQKSTTRREIKRVPVCRPLLWSERPIRGGVVGVRAFTPTRKATSPQNERHSRRALTSPFNRPTNSDASFEVYSCTPEIEPPRVVKTPELTVCSPSVVTHDCSYETGPDGGSDHTKVGVPSLSYAPSTESHASTELTSLTCPSSIEEDHEDEENVEVFFGGAGIEFAISIHASVDGQCLQAIDK